MDLPLRFDESQRRGAPYTLPSGAALLSAGKPPSALACVSKAAGRLFSGVNALDGLRERHAHDQPAIFVNHLERPAGHIQALADVLGHDLSGRLYGFLLNRSLVRELGPVRVPDQVSGLADMQ